MTGSMKGALQAMEGLNGAGKIIIVGGGYIGLPLGHWWVQD